jgi:hypothetical protein
MRRLVLILVVAHVMTALGLKAQAGIELRGNLSANEMEMQEGYFAVAQDTVLMVRPGVGNAFVAQGAFRADRANRGGTGR